MLITSPPTYWLCFVPEYTEITGECHVIAVAPEELIEHVSPDAVQFLTVANDFHYRHPDEQIVFAAELTRWIADDGMTWRDMQVDFFAVLDELTEHEDGVVLEVSPLVLHCVADASRRGREANGSDRTGQLSAEAAHVRSVLARALDARGVSRLFRPKSHTGR